MKKIVTLVCLLALLTAVCPTVSVAKVDRQPGGLPAFFVGCLWGLREGLEWNEGADMHWREWIRIWHDEHKLVALETQSTFRYVRNVVVRPLTDAAPPWEGIVEEGFPSEAIGNPAVWYDAADDPEKLKRNIARMIESCRAFLDLDRIESHPTTEYRLT